MTTARNDTAADDLRRLRLFLHRSTDDPMLRAAILHPLELASVRKIADPPTRGSTSPWHRALDAIATVRRV